MEEEIKQENEAPEEETSPAESPGEKGDESVALRDQLKAFQAQTQRWKQRYQNAKQVIDDLGKDEEPKKEEAPKETVSEDVWREKIEFIASNRDVSTEDVDMLMTLRKQGETLEEAKKSYAHLLEANQRKRESEGKSLSPSGPNKDTGYQMPSEEEMDEIVKDPKKHKEFEEKMAEQLSRTGSKTEA